MSHYAAQVGLYNSLALTYLILNDPPSSASQDLGLQKCTATLILNRCVCVYDILGATESLQFPLIVYETKQCASRLLFQIA